MISLESKIFSATLEGFLDFSRAYLFCQLLSFSIFLHFDWCQMFSDKFFERNKFNDSLKHPISLSMSQVRQRRTLGTIDDYLFKNYEIVNFKTYNTLQKIIKILCFIFVFLCSETCGWKNLSIFKPLITFDNFFYRFAFLFFHSREL